MLVLLPALWKHFSFKLTNTKDEDTCVLRNKNVVQNNKKDILESLY